MPILPEHPDLKQLRRQAKELVRNARTGDGTSLERLSAVSAPLTLAGAQLALARESGQTSWAALVREVEARNATLDENVVRFLCFSVNLQIGTAAWMLGENPALAKAGFPAAVVLGPTRVPTTSRSSGSCWPAEPGCSYMPRVARGV